MRESLTTAVLEGRLKGKRPSRRKRIGMPEELKEGFFIIMKRRAENRVAWRD